MKLVLLLNKQNDRLRILNLLVIIMLIFLRTVFQDWLLLQIANNKINHASEVKGIVKVQKDLADLPTRNSELGNILNKAAFSFNWNF